MKKIDKLTKEQMDAIPAFTQKWIDVGLSTEPADKIRAEKSITKIYKLIGKEQPKFVWVGSPLSANYYIHFLKGFTQVRAQVGAQVYDQLYDQVGAQVRAQVRAQVSDQVRAQVRAQKMELLADYFWGSMEAGWILFYSFFQELGILSYTKELNEKFQLFSDLAHSCGWWYPFEGLCIVCERPDSISMEDGQLSNEKSAAIRFRDGFEAYAINGHRISKKIVTNPESLTIKEIEEEKNAETRRIMIDRYGTGKYLSAVGAEILDVDASNSFRMLIEDKKGNKYLEGTDGSTERIYFMPVPNYAKTCKEAHEAICGIPEEMILMQS